VREESPSLRRADIALGRRYERRRRIESQIKKHFDAPRIAKHCKRVDSRHAYSGSRIVNRNVKEGWNGCCVADSCERLGRRYP
jgi:hypothetical protein